MERVPAKGRRPEVRHASSYAGEYQCARRRDAELTVIRRPAESGGGSEQIQEQARTIRHLEKQVKEQRRVITALDARIDERVKEHLLPLYEAVEGLSSMMHA